MISNFLKILAFSPYFQVIPITGTIFSHSRSKQFWKQNTIFCFLIFYNRILSSISEERKIELSFQNQFIPILLVGSSSCDFRCSFSLRFTRFSQSCSAKKNFLFHWLPKRFYADILLPLSQCILVERVKFNINIEFYQLI